MTQKRITVSEETYKSLQKIKEEKGLNSFEEALSFFPKEEKIPDENKDPQTLEYVLSETAKEDIGKELQELFSNENIEKKGDISARQVMAIAKAKTFADRYNNNLLDDFIKRYVIYSVSKERKGRKEFVEGFKAKILEPLGMGNIMQGGSNNDSTSKEGK
ncbi:MAG: hypothetical protein ACOC56_03730 [Atribacterota bacterium]